MFTIAAGIILAFVVIMFLPEVLRGLIGAAMGFAFGILLLALLLS